MARGWESKSVEEQQTLEWVRPAGPQLPPEELERQKRREGLQLERVRVVHDLETAQNPRYREMMRQALAHLDAKLAALEQ
ncbi:MAG: hypothetical protein ABI693_01500 [Bryobacteraceae bacterium]